MDPLVFEPILKRIRWGGSRLGTLLQKEIGPEGDYAESWEIADHSSDQSRVLSGPYGGRTLNELVRKYDKALLGRQTGIDQFPLLIKFLDANDWLSLQVHPNDTQAKHYDPSENGKTEAWVILESAPDSQICAGLKQGVDADQLKHAVLSDDVGSCLHMISVKPGDCVFVPAGTVHALGPGIVLAEIQQQSNLTFRLHDWGRVGLDGKPRPLHLEQSLACTDFARGPVEPVKPVALANGSHVFEELVRCEYFVIRRHISANPFPISNDERFRIVMVLNGGGRMESPKSVVLLRTGQTVLVPASCEGVIIQPNGPITILEVLKP